MQHAGPNGDKLGALGLSLTYKLSIFPRCYVIAWSTADVRLSHNHKFKDFSFLWCFSFADACTIYYIACLREVFVLNSLKRCNL